MRQQQAESVQRRGKEEGEERGRGRAEEEGEEGRQGRRLVNACKFLA